MTPALAPTPEAFLNAHGTAHRYGEEEEAAASDGAKEGGLALINPATLHGQAILPRTWILPEWVPLHATTALYGDGGVGKSLLAMMLMTAVATGKPFLGLPVRQGKTLGLFCEDTRDELHRRQAEINRVLGCDFADLGDMRWYSGVGEDNILADFSKDTPLTALYKSLRKEALAFGAQLIVIDTAADTFGGNENDRGQVRRFIGALTRLALEVEGAVLLCAHPSVAGMRDGSGYGGNTAWSNSVRSRLYLTRPAEKDGEHDPDARILSRKKANYAGQEAQIRVRWQDGAFVPTDASQGGVVGAVVREQAQRRAQECFLRAVDALTGQGRNLSSSKNSGNYAPKIVRTLSYGQALTTKDLERAMHALFEKGLIREESYGRKSNPARRIVRGRAQEEECTGVS
jgi:RecA-family ATPase